MMVTIEGKELQTYDFDEIKDKCYGFIYVTINKLNQKKYLGQHSGWNEKYLGSGVHLNNSIRKYGIENFVRYIVDVSNTQEELDEKEIFYINEFFEKKLYEDSNWYNIHKGGTGGNTFAGKTKEEIEEIGKKISVEMKGKLSGEKHPLFGMKGENHPRFGKHHSDETRKKIRENNAKYWKGKHHSDETRKKISSSRKGKYEGRNNPRAKRIVLYQPQISEVVGVWGALSECCKWLYEVEEINYNLCRSYLNDQLKNRPRNPSEKYPVLNKVRAYYYDDFIKLFGKEKLVS